MNRRVEILKQDCARHAIPQDITVTKPPHLVLDVAFMYKLNQTGVIKPIRADGTTVLRMGQHSYRIFFRAQQMCYVYLLQQDASETWYRLFPQPDALAFKNPVEPRRDYWVPGFDRWFPLDETRGQERLYLVATPRPLPELETRGSRLSEVAVPITRGFLTRGISHVGTPQRTLASESAPETDIDVAKHLKQVSGTGGFARTITFLHQ
ncbi:hypothetical protein C2W62_25335 [Candidatus Entotheonella serta]|nr:hypothetical protein C2W62_25335 [Candidatus Entotheonella serta]